MRQYSDYFSALPQCSATWRNPSSSAAPTSRIRGICFRELEAHSIYWTACFSLRHCYFFICDSSFACRKHCFHTKVTTDTTLHKLTKELLYRSCAIVIVV